MTWRSMWPAAVAVAAAVAPTGAARAVGTVASETAPLQTAILLAPGADSLRSAFRVYDTIPAAPLLYVDGAARQHADLTKLLGANGVRALDLAALLDNAITNARRAGKLVAELVDLTPRGAKVIAPLDGLNADRMLGRPAAHAYTASGSRPIEPIFAATPMFFYARDFAVTTPHGVVLTHSLNPDRHQETRIGRFLFKYADALKDIPIVMDAEKEDVRCDGGDILVQNDRAIFMGINNMSDRRAAERLAAKSGIQVFGVSMPPLADFSPANVQFLHLNSVFAFVDEKKALTVPYLFVQAFEKDNPLVRLLKNLQDHPPAPAEQGAAEPKYSFDKAIAAIGKMGWLTRFAAGTGQATDLHVKLGDYLLQQGYEIIPIGGEQGNLPEAQYVNERVMYELSLQAASVLALGPGRVVAFAHNTYTNRELERRGLKVETFEGKYLADGLGGPHALTLPIERGGTPASIRR